MIEAYVTVRGEGQFALLHRNSPLARVLVGIIATFAAVSAASAQTVSPPPPPDSLREIYNIAEPCVIQLNVSGSKDGKDVKSQSGTGFIFQTDNDPRLITARHVVGIDSDFGVVPGTVSTRARDIMMNVRSAFGTATVGPYHAANTSADFDVAQVYVERAPKDCLVLSQTRPQLGDELTVVSWPTDVVRPTITSVRVLPQFADDGELIRLDREFHESESGSPVMDRRGVVVAVLLYRDHTQGGNSYSAALPTASFAGWVKDARFAKKACRAKGNGVEFYQRTFQVQKTSPWMGGGFDPGRWCQQAIAELHQENPQDSEFRVVGSSETSHTTCSPFNCPQYQYFCTVEIKTDPVYKIAESEVCH